MLPVFVLVASLVRGRINIFALPLQHQEASKGKFHEVVTELGLCRVGGGASTLCACKCDVAPQVAVDPWIYFQCDLIYRTLNCIDVFANAVI